MVQKGELPLKSCCLLSLIIFLILQLRLVNNVKEYKMLVVIYA